jgi:uncharacterized phage protein (TIGR01671 family)
VADERAKAVREVKFRSWNKKEKAMQLVAGLNWFERKIENVTTGDEGHGTSYHNPSEDYELMQFTGLRDEKGTEVYEGDIIKHPKSEDLVDRGEVYYASDFAMFKLRSGDHEYELWDAINMSGMVVVGNVWENPELLK